jgi:hypothetical protein
MDTYNLGAVQSTTDGPGFNIVGVHGRPLVTFSFDTQEEADAARDAMHAIVAKAKVITPHPPPYPR